MKGPDPRLLSSPGFLAGLSLLLLNDFALKRLFPGALTGKLSDFAGLFVFPLFWAALLRGKRASACALTGLGFAFWKSPYSQPLIDCWNALPLFDVRRAVDATDLWALASLPLAYLYAGRRLSRPAPAPRRALTRLATCAVALVSLFAFAATQQAGDHMVSGDHEYRFDVPREELVERLKRDADVQHVYAPEEDADDLTLRTRTKVCDEGVFASLKIRRDGLKSVLKVSYLIYNCEDAPPERLPALDAEAVRAFERDVVERLRGPAGP